MSATLAASVRAALAGNLWIDESSPGLRTEDAIMYIAAAQLKAVTIALTLDETPDGGDSAGWTLNEAFTKADAIAAISGVAALLGNAKKILAETSDAGTSDAVAANEAAE